MPIKRSMLGTDIPPGPARVLKCLDTHLALHSTCGWRCVCWITALRCDDYTVGGREPELSMNRQMSAIYQLSAELCEVTLLPLRQAVSRSLTEVCDRDVDQLTAVAERAGSC